MWISSRQHPIIAASETLSRDHPTLPDFASFIERLSLIPTAPDAYNQFAAGDNPYNAIRRANLQRYLEAIAARQSKIVLIAEAPGYRGMRLTGVPMVSR